MDRFRLSRTVRKHKAPCSLYLDGMVVDSIAAIAKEEGSSKSALINDILDEYVKRYYNRIPVNSDEEDII
jgi:hypothetical protein